MTTMLRVGSVSVWIEFYNRYRHWTMLRPIDIQVYVAMCSDDVPASASDINLAKIQK